MVWVIVFTLGITVACLCYALGKYSVQVEEKIIDKIINDKSYSTLSDESRERLREKLRK